MPPPLPPSHKPPNLPATPPSPAPPRMHACDVVRNIYIILTKGFGILNPCFNFPYQPFSPSLDTTQPSPPSPPSPLPLPPKRIHACDVVRNIYIILTKGGILKQCFAQDDMPLAMGIIAAAVHDYEHRGVNVSALGGGG